MNGYKTATEALILKMEADHKARMSMVVNYAEREHTFICGELAKTVSERDHLKLLCSGLLEALEALHAVQNGPPLLRYEKEWNEAMRKAEAAMESAKCETVQNISS